jgi:hypothetical protein
VGVIAAAGFLLGDDSEVTQQILFSRRRLSYISGRDREAQ